MVIATWCQREETPETPFSEAEKNDLQFLYDEWAHPYFISIEEYERLMQVRLLVYKCLFEHRFKAAPCLLFGTTVTTLPRP